MLTDAGGALPLALFCILFPLSALLILLDSRFPCWRFDA